MSRQPFFSPIPACGALLTGLDEKLPLLFGQLDVRGVGDKVHLDLPLP